MNRKPANVLYTIDPALALLYIFAYGSVELREVLAFEQVIWQDPLRQPGMKIIADVSLGTELSFELPDLRKQVELNQRMQEKGYALEPTAIIGRHSYDVTLGRIIEMQVQRETPVNMAVFLSLREAVAWLGVAEAYDRIVQIQRDLQQQALALL